MKKEVQFYVNGFPKTMEKDLISFEEIVTLGEGNYSNDFTYTVTYSKGHNDKSKGNLYPGDSIKLKDEMDFTTTKAFKS